MVGDGAFTNKDGAAAVKGEMVSGVRNHGFRKHLDPHHIVACIVIISPIPDTFDIVYLHYPDTYGISLYHPVCFVVYSTGMVGILAHTSLFGILCLIATIQMSR